jgi:hypothetical protein
VQKIGAQAITGAFVTVAASVAEAEAHISSVRERHWRKALKLWVELHTFPESNPLRREASKIVRVWKNGHQSPFQRVAIAYNTTPLEMMETIQPFTLAPWEERIPAAPEELEKGRTPLTDPRRVVGVAVSSSCRNDVVGAGGVGQFPRHLRDVSRDETFAFIPGPRTEQNLHTGELAAIAYVTRRMLPEICNHHIILYTRNKGAILTI